ncbi:MAG: sialate O-acetylesterase [Planctomycetota bacterium]|jgi:sialate O-acetylesterase
MVREAMHRSLHLPCTGMVVTIDVGEASSVHPRDKRTLGERLATWALAQAYGIH